MKKTTQWKLIASVVLAAILLPLFSALAPTEVNAVTVITPLPYGMEQYGQHHSGMYYTATAPVLDGTRDDAVYTLLDSFDDSAGQFGGVFVAANADGSSAGEIASEYVPDLLELYAAYDTTYLYFYVETITRSSGTYSLTPKFGFTFSDSQIDAQSGTVLPAFTVTDAQASVTTADSYAATSLHPVPGNDSSSEYQDYNRNTTVYEFRVAWADIAPAGATPEVDFDRLFCSFVMPFDDLTATGSYWVYGVPNNYVLPSDTTVEAAFGDKAGTYTPNILNLLGEKKDPSVYPEPLATDFTRKDKNTNKIRIFEMTYTLYGVDPSAITETGILYLADASVLGNKALTAQTPGAEFIPATLESNKDGVLTYYAGFETDAEHYNTYFCARPYVKFTGESTVWTYGEAYHNAPSYYDLLFSEYSQYIKLLFISCSFSGYHYDELINICKSQGIHLTVGRTYYSGAKAHEHWDWLLNGWTNDGFKFGVWAPGKTIKAYNGGLTMEQMIHYYDDWDYIGVQDHYGIEMSHEDGYEKSLLSSMPYMPQLFRYLDVNFPNADLFIHQTWAFQLGYGYSNGTAILNSEGTAVVGGTISSGFSDPASRMMTKAQQTQHHENIRHCVYDLSELIGVPLVPSGDAWAIAREDPAVGDHLCDGKKGEEAGDYYHDGEGGGGQYLNALCWYEMITGRDARDVTWKPTYNYPMSDERAAALRNAAHQACEAYRQTGSWQNATINHN